MKEERERERKREADTRHTDTRITKHIDTQDPQTHTQTKILTHRHTDKTHTHINPVHTNSDLSVRIGPSLRRLFAKPVFDSLEVVEKLFVCLYTNI